MNNNEDVFLESFILETKEYTDKQLQESLDRLTESSKRRLVEKVKKFDKAELTLENKNKLMSYLDDFINDITKAVESVRERSKYSEQIKTLKGLIGTAESLKEKLDSDVIRAELKESPKLKTSSNNGEAQK